ncbi:murein L,D-transpeptidase family protein [Neptuniibacter sp. 1_MG-2023]|jgi:murein L,D-transpeptidase YafK|uniref:L,D-transpeptidase family protein n=1 Tax=Neptuniibacter sp. 1_MG-2023 TaxID=3062662 RepID=UPI0026E21BFF|nr:L,D-transpeptidase family protein [Neptuniibacter sp. 1_MG-2023]MDO6593447.1 L,D-transpeptidase family protein [Neptuniibacter sp. 1_MG-2023]
MTKGLIGSVIAWGILSSFGNAAADELSQGPYGLSDGNEELLLSGLKNLSSHELDSALTDLKQLTERRPDFRLAQLVYADILSAQAQGAPLSSSGSHSDKQKIDGLISEAKVRLLMEMEKPSIDMLPADMLKMSENQKYAVVVDTRLSRLFLFENHDGIPVLVKDFYASYGRGGVGKEKRGDLKTPLGVYFITGRLEDKNLPSRYGSGALPLNYPNVWDERLGRTGNGIWLHGSPVETYSRPPKASEGCISLTNPDFIELDQKIDFKDTPVLVGHNIRWIKKQDWLAQSERFNSLIERWAADWESLDHSRYIQNYATNYHDGKRDLKQFSSYKKRVNSSKEFIDVNVDNLSLYRYPDNPDLVVATFRQDYKSSNLQGKSIKRQYWTFENDRWRIAYEGLPSVGKP